MKNNNVASRRASFLEDKFLNRKERGINFQDNYDEHRIESLHIYLLQKRCHKLYPAARSCEFYFAEAILPQHYGVTVNR